LVLISAFWLDDASLFNNLYTDDEKAFTVGEKRVLPVDLLNFLVEKIILQSSLASLFVLNILVSKRVFYPELLFNSPR
jgi:hypothetical protein